MSAQVEVTVSSAPEHDEIQVITLQGEVDEFNLGKLKEAVDPLLEDETNKCFVFVLKDLTFINSKVIGYLASLYNTMNERGKKMAFAEANTTIMEILSLVGLTNLINHYESAEEAIQSCM